jgi:peptide/nickel transport system substrate-binding protein
MPEQAMSAEVRTHGRWPRRRPLRNGGARYLAATAIMVTAPLLISAPAPQHAGPDQPVFGGTLKIVAAGGPDHLDTVPAYFAADYILERAYARQLLSYPTEPDRALGSAGWKADITPVPDIATVVPTVANGGISDGGKTYTFHIRSGVDWNTDPVRPVASLDFLREFKAFCNPVSPVGNPLYFTATIKGLQQYCGEERSYFATIRRPTAAQIANFQNTHAIVGITTPDPATISFHLISPASDFLYMLALPFASARPAEYDSYLPDSPQLDQHMLSDGPYQITSDRRGRSITLQRNVAWKQSSDPIRHQYVQTITVTIGITWPQTQLDLLKAGRSDLVLDTSVQPGAIPRLRADPDFHIWPGSSTNPYIVFNLRSPNSHSAMGKLEVRKAIEYGVSKFAIQKFLGGTSVSTIINTAMPPGNIGYVNYNLYPTPGERGSPSRCRAELARAGYRRGLTLRYLYPNDSINSPEFTSIQASLKRCRIKLIGEPQSGDTYFTSLGDTRQTDKRGTFDLATTGWFPDWFGNNGRNIIATLFQTRCVLNTNNYGCFSSPTVDKLIHAAETAPTLRAAASFWHQADEQVMKDAVIVPLIDGQNPIYTSSRVREAGLSRSVVLLPNIGGPDVTNIWLKNG